MAGFLTLTHIKLCHTSKLASMTFDLFMLQMDVIQRLLSFFSLAKRSMGPACPDGPPTFWSPLALLALGLRHGINPRRVISQS